MARKLVFLLLLLVALIGAVSAAEPAAGPAPNDNDTVGTVDGDVADGPAGQDQAVAGPLGSEQAAAAAGEGSSGCHITVGLFSTVVVVIAGYFVF